MARIFISYARKDGQQHAERLKDNLEELGYQVFLDIDSIPGGKDWEEFIHQQVAQADILIALVTPSFNSSKYAFVESDEAIKLHKVVIPVVTEGTPLPGFLHRWNAVLLDETDFCKTILKIERSIRECLPQPSAPSPVEPSVAARKPTRSVYPVVTAVLAVLLIGAIGLLLRQPDNPTVSADPTAVTCPLEISRTFAAARDGGVILAPAPCRTDLPAHTMINTVGTYSQEFENKSLWLMAYTDGKYWPQAIDGCREGGPYTMDKNFGTWAGRFSFGGSGVVYDIVLFGADAGGEADNRLNDWWKASCAVDDYPGIPAGELPSGLFELDSILMRSE